MPLISSHVATGRTDSCARCLLQQVNMDLRPEQFNEAIIKAAANLQVEGCCIECNPSFDIGHIDVEDKARHSVSVARLQYPQLGR